MNERKCNKNGDKMKYTKTGCEVITSDSGTITIYTTREKAEKLVQKHPLLNLTIREVGLGFWEWFGFKLIFS